MYNTPDGSNFLALGRIYSGSVRVGQRVKVLGETYSLDDDEDMAMVDDWAKCVCRQILLGDDHHDSWKLGYARGC